VCLQDLTPLQIDTAYAQLLAKGRAGRPLSPKSVKNSRRRIALDAETVTALREHKRRQSEEHLTIGPAWQREPDLVFRELDGQPLHPDWFTNEFKRQARAARLGGLRRPHGLRHTWATLALQAGIHPKVVSERLGHSTISITLDTYSHVMPGLDIEAATSSPPRSSVAVMRALQNDRCGVGPCFLHCASCR
jgi:integrase